MLIKERGRVIRFYQLDAGKGGFLEQGLGHLLCTPGRTLRGILGVSHVPYGPLEGSRHPRDCLYSQKFYSMHGPQAVFPACMTMFQPWHLTSVRESAKTSL